MIVFEGNTWFAGRELFDTYGRLPNSQLLATYCFALYPNPFDVFNVVLPVSEQKESILTILQNVEPCNREHSSLLVHRSFQLQERESHVLYPLSDDFTEGSLLVQVPMSNEFQFPICLLSVFLALDWAPLSSHDYTDESLKEHLATLSFDYFDSWGVGIHAHRHREAVRLAFSALSTLEHGFPTTLLEDDAFSNKLDELGVEDQEALIVQKEGAHWRGNTLKFRSALNYRRSRKRIFHVQFVGLKNLMLSLGIATTTKTTTANNELQTETLDHQSPKVEL
jgi:hypothetical protein